MRSVIVFYYFILLALVAKGLSYDACQQEPAVDGFGMIASCAHYSNWFSYHPDTNECLEFSYGGCGGNDNKFTTKKICETVCKM
ncbi:protease inhibitor [Drosophila takahashii]|uniref:protease inhibitor n=1 Tax=Drosophila takahashii TaxID=29030 RepID=UPI0007E85F17|nr:protease inhibitor [Drosophila takahashii]